MFARLRSEGGLGSGRSRFVALELCFVSFFLLCPLLLPRTLFCFFTTAHLHLRYNTHLSLALLRTQTERGPRPRRGLLKSLSRLLLHPSAPFFRVSIARTIIRGLASPSDSCSTLSKSKSQPKRPSKTAREDFELDVDLTFFLSPPNSSPLPFSANV